MSGQLRLDQPLLTASLMAKDLSIVALSSTPRDRKACGSRRAAASIGLHIWLFLACFWLFIEPLTNKGVIYHAASVLHGSWRRPQHA